MKTRTFIHSRSCAAKALVLTLGVAALPAAALAQGDVVDRWEIVATEAESAEAAAAGESDAASPAEAPTDRTIGVMLLSGQSASSLRVVDAAKKVGALFGFEVIECDPNFDSQKVAQCATSLVAQNADVIFSASQNPGPMGSALADAGARGITWFGTVDEVTPSPDMIGYGAPGSLTAGVISEWLLAEMAERFDPPLQVMALTAPTVGIASLAQEETMLADVEADPDAEMVVKHDLDLAQIVQDTLSTTQQTLQQYPGLTGTWTVCDFCVPLIAQAVETAGVAAEDRPVVSGNYATPQTISGLREGSIDGIVDLPWEAAVWVAMDQMLSKWARGTEVANSFDVFSEGYSLTFMEPYMVTAENVGESGPAPIFGPDFESYFRAKWKAEYGVE